MLVKTFILAICTFSASASVIGHQHLGRRHQSSLQFSKRAGSGPGLVERQFGSAGPLTSLNKAKRNQRRALHKKSQLCKAPATSTKAPESTAADPTKTTEEDSTTKTPKPTSTSKPDDDPPKGDKPSSGDGKIHKGEITFYDVGLGACGLTNSNDELVAAVSIPMFDNFPGYAGGNPNNNPICGRSARVKLGGKQVTVKLIDRCGACDEDDLDLSPAAFDKLADRSKGRIAGMEWEFV